MKFVVLGLAMLAALVIQAAFSGPAVLQQPKPPVLLAVVLYYALSCGGRVSEAAALGAGLLQDGLSLMPMGTSSLVFLVIAWVASRYRRQVQVESVGASLVLGAVVAAAWVLMTQILLAGQGQGVPGILRPMIKTLSTTILAAGVTPLVFFGLGALERAVGTAKAEGGAREPDGL